MSQFNTDKTFDNNIKTITKQKNLTQRQSNGEPEQEISGKFRSQFLCFFSESQLKPTISLSDLNREYNFLLDLNWLARKTPKKTTYL